MKFLLLIAAFTDNSFIFFGAGQRSQFMGTTGGISFDNNKNPFRLIYEYYANSAYRLFSTSVHDPAFIRVNMFMAVQKGEISAFKVPNSWC